LAHEMSGHSKWAKIRHQKAENDAKRGAIFTKLLREVRIAAKKGSDPEMNFSLKSAIQKAKSGGVPKEKIESAIKSSKSDESLLEEVFYEAYGAGGVGILIKCITDNKNRTFSEVRTVLDKNGGSIANVGSVRFLFREVGEIITEPPGDKDSIEWEEKILELDIEDYSFDAEGNKVLINTDFQNLAKTIQELEGLGFIIFESYLTFYPKNPLDPPFEVREKIDSLVSKIENLDDVQEIWTNLS